MDESKEYIKMCEKAEEIQNLWKPHKGDYPHTWLPRQDQLQEMIDISESPMETLCILSNRGIERGIQEASGFLVRPAYTVTRTDLFKYFHKFKSMEQLWLAFVYDQKYNKRWNGEDWIP